MPSVLFWGHQNLIVLQHLGYAWGLESHYANQTKHGWYSSLWSSGSLSRLQTSKNERQIVLTLNLQNTMLTIVIISFWNFVLPFSLKNTILTYATAVEEMPDQKKGDRQDTGGWHCAMTGGSEVLPGISWCFLTLPSGHLTEPSSIFDKKVCDFNWVDFSAFFMPIKGLRHWNLCLLWTLFAL